MPKIPVRVRMEVLTLYFEGISYDEIVEEMERRGRPVSKGSMVSIVKELREGVYPRFDLVLDQVEHLRQLAIACRKQGLSVSEASLGLILFKRLIRLGVEPPSVKDWIKMCKRLSPPGYPVERFVNSALMLKELEGETGKSYGELIQSFKETQTGLAKLEKDRRKKRKEMEKELQRLSRQRENVEATFKKQGLSWDEGAKILKDIIDLRKEFVKLKSEEVVAKARLKEEKGKLEAARRQVFIAKGRKLRLEEEISELSRIHRRYRDWYNREAPRMDEYESALLKSIHRLKEQKRELKETNSQLQERNQRLKVEIGDKERKIKELEDAEKKTREALKVEIEKGRKKLREDTQKKRRKIEEMQEKLRKIVEKREEEKERLRRARREREKIERTLRWLRPTLNSKREELKETVKTLKELEEAIKEREKKLDELTRSPIRLPKLPSLPKEVTN